MRLDAAGVPDDGAQGGGGEGRDQEDDRDGDSAALAVYGGLNPALRRSRVPNVVHSKVVEHLYCSGH